MMSFLTNITGFFMNFELLTDYCKLEKGGMNFLKIFRFGLIWFSGFRGEDLNVIFIQNMPNLHNRYKSAERKISQKNSEYMLNYSYYCKLEKGGMNFLKIFSSETTEPISTKLC
jgi:hypothetical protein